MISHRSLVKPTARSSFDIAEFITQRCRTPGGSVRALYLTLRARGAILLAEPPAWQIMSRLLPICIALLLACAACGPRPEATTGVPTVQVADKQEVSADQIKQDVVGKVLRISDVAGKGPADEWTFEASEFK